MLHYTALHTWAPQVLTACGNIVLVMFVIAAPCRQSCWMSSKQDLLCCRAEWIQPGTGKGGAAGCTHQVPRPAERRPGAACGQSCGRRQSATSEYECLLDRDTIAGFVHMTVNDTLLTSRGLGAIVTSCCVLHAQPAKHISIGHACCENQSKPGRWFPSALPHSAINTSYTAVSVTTPPHSPMS